MYGETYLSRVILVPILAKALVRRKGVDHLNEWEDPQVRHPLSSVPPMNRLAFKLGTFNAPFPD